MVLAAYLDTGYKILFFLHILAVIVAFAPAFTSPVLVAKIKKAEGEGALPKLAGHLHGNARTIHFPALILVGLFGLGLVGMSDGFAEFSDTWVILALIVWIAICGVVSAVITPSEKALGGGDLAAEKKIALGGQIASVLLLVMLYLMIFKPGA
jgi:uncharacterized membrane protein